VDRTIPTIANSLPTNCPALFLICSRDLCPNRSPNIHAKPQEKRTIIRGLRRAKRLLNDSIHIAPEEKGPSMPNSIDVTASLEILRCWVSASSHISLIVSSITIGFVANTKP
jgi:hypothetical protein